MPTTDFNTANIKDILRQQPLFADFNEAEIEQLCKLFVPEAYESGEFILQENCTSSDLYYIHSGTAQVINTEKNKDYILFELGTNEFFGELTFIDEQQRSSSIKAATKAIVFRLKKTDMDNISEEYSYLKDKLIAQLSKIIIERLRNTNKKNLLEMEHRNRLGKFSILIMIGLSLITCLTGFIKTIREHIPIYLVAPIVMAISTVLFIKMLKVVGMPLKHFGFTWKGSKKSLVEGTLLSVVLTLLFYLFATKENALYAKNILTSNYRGVIYFIVALAEEIIYRGILQTALQETYQDSKGYFSVMLTALLFGISHVYLGFLITVASFGAGVLLGFIYLRHKNLVGVTIVHFVLGCMAVGFHLIGT